MTRAPHLSQPTLAPALLALLAVLYLLAGAIGHDPWRGEDIDHFGPIFDILRGHGWLAPSVAGEFQPEAAPLYYWTGAALAWLLSPLLPLHDGARLASAAHVGLTLFALSLAARRLFGTQAGAAAPLLLLGSLGLVVHAHEMQANLALMSGLALCLAGLAELPMRPWRGALTGGLGGGLAMLAAGVVGAVAVLPLLILLPWTGSRPSATGERIAVSLSAPLLAIALPALWLAGLAWTEPAAAPGLACRCP